MDTTPTGGGSGRPKRPGWWWKRRKERLKKQRQAAAAEAAGTHEAPRGEQVPENPRNEVTAPGNENNPNTIPTKKKKNKKRKRKNKKNSNTEDTARPRRPRRSNLRPIQEERDDEEDAVSDPESDSYAEPLKHFFARYEGFDYQPSCAATDEFDRLSVVQNWGREGPARMEAYLEFGDALASQFNRTYGKKKEDLAAWQKLCKRIGIDPIPDELEQAKELVCNTHVNLVDLTTQIDESEKVRTFPSEVALSRYTRKYKRMFPQSQAAGTLLYSLLRRIHKPPREGSRRTSNNDLIEIPN